jgi:beta-lactamase superfamily II metal-dependent hydrolase
LVALLGTIPFPHHRFIISGICYSWWFVSLAVTVAIAQALSPWVREKIVTGVQLAMDTIAYGGMVYFLWPTHSDKYFKVAAPDVGGEYDSLINETM